MVNEEKRKLGTNRSCIRDLFEYGMKKAAEIGRENVFDFSIGNPSVPAPRGVNDTIAALVAAPDAQRVHGYTSAAGAPDAREAIAKDLGDRFACGARAQDLFLTCGAAPALTAVLAALCVEGAEVVIHAPFFPEYTVFAAGAGMKSVIVPADTADFQLHAEATAKALTPHTQAVIVNSPNNPSGVVYTEETIRKLAEVLEKKEEEYGHPIYLITDEPYRELVYDDIEVPFVTKYYKNTVVCYSYSKSLALPGERIGYVLVPDEIADSKDVYAAVCGAGRALGYVCAPSLMQHVIEKCTGQVSDMNEYREKRDLIYNALTDLGFTCIHPDGAFYLFVKSPVPDAGEFSAKAKEFDLLLVPADSFGTPGFVRIAYCVATDMIKRSLPAFEKLAAFYKDELAK